MNRRGILGAMIGSPIAGPEIAKNAMQGISLGGFAGSEAVQNTAASGIMLAARSMMEPEDAVRKAYRMGLVPREKLLELLSCMRIESSSANAYNLDADLQSMKSFSLATRIRMQRDRNADREIDRFLARPRSFWDYGRELLTNGVVKDDAA